jgi:hypothetical protein
MKTKYIYIPTGETVLAEQVPPITPTDDKAKDAEAFEKGKVNHGPLTGIPPGAWLLYTVDGHPLPTAPSDSNFKENYKEAKPKSAAAEKPAADPK